MIKDFCKTEILKKKLKRSVFLHFATTTHCNFKFKKIDPPYRPVSIQKKCYTEKKDKYRREDKGRRCCLAD